MIADKTMTTTTTANRNTTYDTITENLVKILDEQISQSIFNLQLDYIQTIKM
jgi:hypothetical protein